MRRVCFDELSNYHNLESIDSPSTTLIVSFKGLGKRFCDR
jgi:hypothetical protein